VHPVIYASRRAIVFRQLPLHSTATLRGCTGHVTHPFRLTIGESGIVLTEAKS
jgi:hypothetical protein